MLMSKEETKELMPTLRFPQFKMSGNWKSSSLDKLGETISGLSGKSASDFGEGKPFVTYMQVFTNSVVNFEQCGRVKVENNERQNKLQKGDVLITTSSETPEEVGFASVILDTPPEDVYLNSFCFAFRPYELVELVPQFSSFLFRSPIYRKAIGVLAQGSTRFNISKSGFLNLTLPLPSPAEQQKIADCLSSLDGLMAAQSSKLEALKAHKKGLMQALFPAEGETVPKLRFAEFKDSGEWEEKTLGDALIKHPEYGLNAAAVPYSENLPTYLRITDISEEGIFLKQNKVSVSQTVTNDNYLSEGDIVLARTGASVGKSYKYKIEDGRLVFAGFLIRVQPDESKLNSELLYQFLSTDKYWKWVAFTSQRSGQPGINGNEYASLRIPLPPSIEEQQKIADCLSSLDALITAQTEKLEALKLHKKGLMQGLFPNTNEPNK